MKTSWVTAMERCWSFTADTSQHPHCLPSVPCSPPPFGLPPLPTSQPGDGHGLAARKPFMVPSPPVRSLPLTPLFRKMRKGYEELTICLSNVLQFSWKCECSPEGGPGCWSDLLLLWAPVTWAGEPTSPTTSLFRNCPGAGQPSPPELHRLQWGVGSQESLASVGWGWGHRLESAPEQGIPCPAPSPQGDPL